MLPEAFHIPAVFVVLAAVVSALTFLRAAPDAVLTAGLTVLLACGVIAPKDALEEMANEGLIAVAALFVVAEGLKQTGGLSFIGQQWIGRPTSLIVAQLRILTPSAVMSAFLNNTPVVAMMMPIVADWARKNRISVTYLLMPLSFAAILGGLCTLIGTSTTLVVHGLLRDYERLNDLGTGAGLSMFEVAWVGFPATIFGLLYLLFAGQKILTERRPAITFGDDPREYTVEMTVEPGSPLVGKSIEEAGLRHLSQMYLSEIERGDRTLVAVAPTECLEANDRLVFVGIVDSVVDLRKIPGLVPATDQTFKLNAPTDKRVMVEAVVSNTCPFLRMSIREARFRSHYNAVVIAVARNGQRLRQKIGDIELLPGDTLLLEAPPGFLTSRRNSRDFFLVSEVEDSTPPRHDKAWLARLVMVAMVAVVTAGLLPMMTAALLAGGLLVVFRCCRIADARRSIDWSVLITMAAGLGLGAALDKTGGARVIAEVLIRAAGDNPWVVLAIVYFLTMIFTNLITAKAAAVLFFPIAMAGATGLGVSHKPFAIAVVVSAAATFATPIGYQTNLMVFGPGGYRFSDFLRLGGPLSLIVAAITLVLTPFIWPF
ncbi:SLC13 family permease [Stratiformator vulcanicus]|uniref:Sodium-dependent dicarboxylate transporter SdcS n=1 Tax=Stratiformator vulcanicus TaxID=2527980 RepID=A0A517R4H7_9PLAN|nr:SLC13 family permease [Stratiformator vulcanicus]QDT38789.1 Sodium-dependent dicarboxylate transporter SdcS [Stratiformator vulcanicus]